MSLPRSAHGDVRADADMVDQRLSSLPADQLAEKMYGLLDGYGFTHAGPVFTTLAELVRRLKTAEDALEQMECRCYDVPTLAPTDNPIEHVCDRCRALAAIRPNPEEQA